MLTGPKGMLWRFNRETMNIPNVTIKQLLEAGVHLGHKTLRWNPKMKQFIFGEKDSIHIIDLTKTLPLIKNAMKDLRSFPRNDKVSQVDTRAFCIYGEKSDYVKEKFFPIFKNYFSNISFYKIKNAGHFLHIESPDEFYQVSSNFLKN